MTQRTSKAWREAVDAVHGAESKYKRLVKAIAGEIESAVLVSGARLPPQRDVAAELGISVQTVTNAYKELERQGLIRCEVGRGSFVAGRITERVSNYILDTAEREVVDFSIARIKASHCAAAAGTSNGSLERAITMRRAPGSRSLIASEANTSPTLLCSGRSIAGGRGLKNK